MKAPFVYDGCDVTTIDPTAPLLRLSFDLALTSRPAAFRGQYIRRITMATGTVKWFNTTKGFEHYKRLRLHRARRRQQRRVRTHFCSWAFRLDRPCWQPESYFRHRARPWRSWGSDQHRSGI